MSKGLEGGSTQGPLKVHTQCLSLTRRWRKIIGKVYVMPVLKMAVGRSLWNLKTAYATSVSEQSDQ